jgi:hypothetical protein
MATAADALAATGELAADQESERLDLTARFVDSTLAALDAGNPLPSGYPDTPEEDVSMFMGISGVGLSLLALAGCKPFDVMLPLPGGSANAGDAPIADYTVLSASADHISERLIACIYPRTLMWLRQHAPQVLTAFHAERADADAGLASFREAVNGALEAGDSTVPAHRSEQLRDLLDLESWRHEVDLTIPGFSYLQIRAIVNQSKLVEIEGELSDPLAMAGQTLRLDPLAGFRETKFDWLEREHDQAEPTAEEAIVIAQPTVKAIVLQPLNTFSLVTLQAFAEPTACADAFEQVAEQFELDSDAERQQLQAFFYNQIAEAIRSGLLLAG